MIRHLGLHHVSLIVTDTRRALDFYQQILEMKIDGHRPDLDFPGAWLVISGQQQLHLLELPDPDAASDRPQHAGRDRHCAFRVNDLETLIHNLEKHHINYTTSRSGRRALFCRDPDGNGLEFIEDRAGR